MPLMQVMETLRCLMRKIKSFQTVNILKNKELALKNQDFLKANSKFDECYICGIYATCLRGL